MGSQKHQVPSEGRAQNQVSTRRHRDLVGVIISVFGILRDLDTYLRPRSREYRTHKYIINDDTLSILSCIMDRVIYDIQWYPKREQKENYTDIMYRLRIRAIDGDYLENELINLVIAELVEYCPDYRDSKEVRWDFTNGCDIVVFLDNRD